jgi:nitrite reductase (NADH) small subunit
MNDWKKLCPLDEIPRLGSRVVASVRGDIAIFRTADDEVFAMHDKCPHKGGPLSQGIVTGKVVTCPLHSWKIQLGNGEAVAPDVGCVKPFAVKLEDGAVWLAV